MKAIAKKDEKSYTRNQNYLNAHSKILAKTYLNKFLPSRS